jgi:hypothetical protein
MYCLEEYIQPYFNVKIYLKYEGNNHSTKTE